MKKVSTLSTAERVAKILLHIKAVIISPKKPFRFTSGILSPIYTDNRLLMGYPFKRTEITIYMANLLREKGLEPDVIAGTATAGIPPAAWLAELLHLPMIYVRASKKAYGKENQVEGILSQNAHVVIIEDLISTGKSSLGAVDAIRDAGGKVDTCLAFFDYGFKETKHVFRKKKVNLYTLTTFETLINMASRMELLSQKEKPIVLEWNKDPWGWEKKIKVERERERSVDY